MHTTRAHARARTATGPSFGLDSGATLEKAALSQSVITVLSPRLLHLARELHRLVAEEPGPVDAVEGDEEQRHQDAEWISLSLTFVLMRRASAAYFTKREQK